MSQHSSLKGTSVGTRHRNVLKRYERIRTLQNSDSWDERKSVYKLPKVKLIKLKVKKAKSEKAAEGQAEGASPTATAPAAQAGAPQKPAPEKVKGSEKTKGKEKE